MLPFKNISIGFICSTYRSRLSTNHSLKLKNLNKKSVIVCVLKNLEDLIKLLDLSKKLGCKIFRLGSEFIPFASHPNFKKEWFREISKLIKDFLPDINKFNIRITMHPGQYVILSTEKKDLLKRSLDELKYHFWVLEQMEKDENSIVVIHGGGIYGNKEKAKRILSNNIKNNSWLKERIALENDEKNYSALDILEVCNDLDLPFVFDYFHHNIFWSDINFKDIFKTWNKRIPEFHLSSSSKKKKFVHGDYVLKEDFLKLVHLITDNIPRSVERVDILLEAKKKELAVKKLMRELSKSV